MQRCEGGRDRMDGVNGGELYSECVLWVVVSGDGEDDI